MQSFTNLSAAMAHLKATSYAEDQRKASALRKSAHLSAKRPGTGPRIAR